ncbi:MAG: helix-turn-helix domain-containing protein [Zoogloeaceae bacterium]|nr:helix-turn-helix domain-containing protein [Zoogloeaceae bacterium]
MEMINDPIRRTLLLVKEASVRGPLTDAALLQIERAVRGEFGGDVFYVAQSCDKAARNAAILADLKAGLSKREVARRHGLTARTISDIAKKS